MSSEIAILEVTTQLAYWGPLILFAIGIPSILINAIVFIVIKQFRQSPSSYYVVGQSIADLSALSLVFLQSQSLPSMSSSRAACKSMLFLSQVTIPVAMSFLCFSAFDRWACTSRSARMRELSSKHAARILFPCPFIFWSLVSIPYLVFCDIVPPFNLCWVTNELFAELATYFIAPIFSTIFPLLVLIILCGLTFRNIRLVTRFHQDSTRNRLSMWEQQMTRMMIGQSLLTVCCSIPRTVFIIYSMATLKQRDLRSIQRIVVELLLDQLTVVIFCINFVSSFYIFFLSSPRFRQTLKVYVRRWLHLRSDQVGPMPISHTAPGHSDKLNTRINFS